VRDLTVDLFSHIRMFSVSFNPRALLFALRSVLTFRNACMQVGVQFLQSLNHFQRYAYVRQAHARESRGVGVRDASGPGLLAPTFSRTPSHRGEPNQSAG
jgi:hypothetical protein